ncbi:hypothetical protein RD792_007814 [Penstemon davidsonii]|uniref:Protein NEDD1 n=1 Tax=Penstemon davidsonii TaxID=160366 RepID=A0ABR0D8F1_9LAMI|nr:hypothetical protein RD792_007814 [Penstemon davidsonii]
MDTAKLLLAASGGDTVKLFDISVEPQNPCILAYSPSPGLHVNSVKWNHNNLVLASAGEDSNISLWKKSGQSLWTVPAKNFRGEIVEITAVQSFTLVFSDLNNLLDFLLRFLFCPFKKYKPSESVSAISFSNKGSRYLCSGGSGQVVRIWDLQNKRCVKWLKGHTDTITGVMYNCKDEHIASVSRKGDLILHNLSSGTKAAELRDPNGQVLGALDYSRVSRHLLVTAGDDGSIHMWDTTGRSPKVSWLKQHSAPTSGISFSPTNDKIIASVGLDMKLYTFDSGSRKPSSCIPYEAPFSSLAFTDDGLTLAAGTSTGQVVFYDVRGKPQPITVLRAYGNSESTILVTASAQFLGATMKPAVINLCWQRSKPVTVNEHNCTDENVLLAGDAGDSVLMPDPLPSRASSILSMTSGVSGSQNPGRSSSGDFFSYLPGSSGSASSAYSLTSSEVTPLRSSLLTGGALARLNAPRSHNFKDDMEVFSPLVEVQPITPLDKLWDNRDGPKKDQDRKPSFQLLSGRFVLSEDGANDNHLMFDLKSNSSSKQENTHTPVSTLADDSSSIPPPEAGGGERLSDKYLHHQRPSINMSRFALLTSTNASSGSISSGLQDSLRNTSSGLSLNSLIIRETSNQKTPIVPSQSLSSPLATKNIITGQNNLDTLGPALSYPRRLLTYAERTGATTSLSDASPFQVGSPKSKKTGAEIREELLNSVLSRSEMPSVPGSDLLTNTHGGVINIAKNSLQSESQQGTSFTLQLFQRTLEENLGSFQNSIHVDVRNLHIEFIRQFHQLEMEMFSVNKLIVENQAEMMKELQALRKENQQLRQLLGVNIYPPDRTDPNHPPPA